MPKVMNSEPYCDDYNRDKGYVQILAVPGKAEQAREFTQLGSMNLDFIGRLGDAVFSNGYIIEGCNVVVRDKKATITSGRIYLDGLVRIVPESVVDISAVGEELIGAKIVSSIITEIEDPSLRDPAQGYENYGQEGCHRLKEVIEFCVNDTECTTLFKLIDGEVAKEISNELDNTLVETLARRTYDESGNYRVDGLELRDRNESNDNQILISLTEGKAYIRGYEITKPTATTIYLDKSRETRTVRGEVKTYDVETVLKFKLNNSPIAAITSVEAITEVTEQVRRGNYRGGIDFFSNEEVDSIIRVWQNDTEYTAGVDYSHEGNGISWASLGKEPETTTSYHVTYRYNRKYVSGIDYELVKETTSNGVEQYFLQFLSGSGAVNPVYDSVHKTKIYIDYDFFLARKDLICLNRNGRIEIIKGKSDRANLTEPEINQDSNRITIGSVLILPNSSHVVIANSKSSRLSMDDLYKLSKRIDNLEYNQAMSDLDKEAEAGENATSLKGIFTDGFLGTSKCDLDHEEFDCSIDLDSNELTLPIFTTIDKLDINKETFDTTVTEFGNYIMAPYKESLALSQPKVTGSMLVNPYAVYNPMSLLTLSPAVDNWIDTSHITVNENKTAYTTLRRWWYHRGERWAETEKGKYIQLGYADGGASLGWSNGSYTEVSQSSKMILDEAVTYMRQIEVKVSGQNFYPDADNVECYFNDTLIPLTPLGSTKAGTNSGTIRVGLDGKLTAKFTVPPNTPCGSVDVVLKCPLCEGSAVYQAQGRKQVIQDTVLRTTTIIRTTDPLAQSFGFDDDTVVSSIGLYFASKASDKAVVVQVRNMVNGYPGTTCYARTVLTPEEVKVSADGTAETRVKFDQPIYCHADDQYCVCILSDSNVYSLYVANLGEKELLTDNYLTSNPYLAGVLFSSSNAMTWTAHQSSDLKFNVYKMTYIGDGCILFKEVSGLSINRLLVAAQAVDYKNNGIEWYYKTDNINSWLPIETYVDRELPLITGKVSLKAILKVTPSTSPILASDCINLIGFIEGKTGAYVSRSITMDETFSKIKIIFDACIPSGTDVQVFYSLDDSSGNWVKINSPTSVSQVDEEFSTFEYNVTNISPSRSYKIKLELSTMNQLVRPRVRKLRSILTI